MKKNIIAFGIIIILIICFVLINEVVTEKNKRTFEPKADTNKYAYQVESVGFEDQDYVIKGWFFELRSVKGVEIEVQNNKSLGVILLPLNGEDKKDNNSSSFKEGVKMNLEYQKRPDVNKYFKCDYDYSNSGFTAKISKSSLDLENIDYQVIFKPEETGVDGVESLVFIHKGNISYVNPQDIVELDVAGTDLEKIVNEGMCILSYPENKVYGYQYGWDLYYIVEEGFQFKNNSTFMELLYDTTQFNRIEGYHPNNEWYDVNIGEYFEKGEITNTINCGKYRVFKNSLKREYSIVKALTGCYSGDSWIWKKSFRPFYELTSK